MQSRIRLPEGFARFRKDLGRIIRRRRRGEKFLQQDFAKDVGISRESLSRIEHGHAWPSYDTVYRIMGLLSLEWHEIAIKGRTGRAPRTYRDTTRDDCRVALGADLRAARNARGWSLRHLAGLCGLSYSQISRIERGESLYSCVLEEDPKDRKLDYEQRGMRFSHTLLDRLASGQPLEGCPTSSSPE